MTKFKINKKIIGYLLTAVILGLFSYYFVNNINDFKMILEVNPFALGILAALYIFLFWIRGFFYKFILEPYSVKLSSFDGFFSSFITSFGNYFLPMQSGAGIRAVYLKRKYNFKYTDFISTLSGTFVLTFAIISFLGLLATFVIYKSDINSGFVLYLLFCGVLLICLLATLLKFSKVTEFLMRLVKIKFVDKLINIAHEILISWEYLLTHKPILFKLAGVIFVDLFFYMILTQVEFLAFGIHISFFEVLLYITLGAFSVLVNITPGAIGIKEAIFLVFSEKIGLTSTAILNIAVLDRGMQFIILILIFLWLKVFRREEMKMITEDKKPSKDT